MPEPDQKIWSDILAHVRRHDATRCRNWFDDLEVAELSGGVLRLRVPQPYYLAYLERECRALFTDAAQAVTGRLVAVQFMNGEAPTSARGRAAGRAEAASGIARKPASAGAGSSQSNGSSANGSQRRDGGGPNRTARDGRSGEAAEVAGEGSERRDVATGRPIATLIEPKDERLRENSRPIHEVGQAASCDDYGRMLINPEYSFENFIVGPNNRLAHAAAVAVAKQPGAAYNPYFIHGGVGLGKTHLLQAICQTLLRTDEPPLIYYVSCEEFSTQFLDAVQAGQMAQFRHRFRDVDVLVVDDIHFLAGHDRTQEEFFHTFNSLYQLKKQIILSSDAAPEEIPQLEERLHSRFKSGLVARIDKPDYETRLQILRNKASLRGLEIADEVLCYIAHRVDSNIRVLEGALTQVQGHSMATGRPISMDLAREALGDDSPATTPAVSVQEIIQVVATYYGVKTSEILSKKRNKSITEPRQVAMYLARKRKGHSLTEIGYLFGGRDHTTVMHGVNKMTTRRESDAGFARVLEQLERELHI